MPTLTLKQTFDLAVQHHRAGRLADAQTMYRQILRVHPDHAETLFHLGMIARQSNQPAEAAAWWRRVTSLQPGNVSLLLEISHALIDANEPYDAASLARQIIGTDPAKAEAHALLARALAAMEKPQEAAESVRLALSLTPSSAQALNHAGLALGAAGNHHEARDAFTAAIALQPNIAVFHRNLAGVFDALDEAESAIASARTAMRLGGEDVQIWINLAILHRRRRDYQAAVQAARRAVELQPANPEAHGSLAIALLCAGDYTNGFIEYEWRWRCGTFTTRPRDFGRPMWDGSDPRGRTIYVHSEQGFGDTIQFVRFVPLLAQRGAKVILECHPSLRTLLRSVEGVSKVVASGVTPPDFDLHAPLLSLMRHFGTTSVEAVPNRVPYLTPDPQLVEAWRQRIAGAGRRIGLIWSGNVKPDPHRTCPLSQLSPLADMQGVTFYSLQIGSRDQQDAPMPIVDLAPNLKDFAESAAAMQCMDLIISIDTAAAHLAGALARPVWTLLPWAPDWRWGLDREDSPWYPTMRLFRQERMGDWSQPVARIAAALKAFTSPDC